MKTMKKQLFYIFLRIIGMSVPATFVLVFILQLNNSHRYHNCYMPLFTEILLSFAVLAIGLCSISIFLNLNTKFRSNPIKTAFSFVLCPFLLTIFFVLTLMDDLTDAFGMLHILAMVVPVWFMILWEYFKFKKQRLTIEK